MSSLLSNQTSTRDDEALADSVSTDAPARSHSELRAELQSKTPWRIRALRGDQSTRSYRPSQCAPDRMPSSKLSSIDTRLALQLGRRQLRNDLRSSLPMVAADLLAISISLACAQAVATFTQSAFDPMLGLIVVLFTLLMQHVHGLYPACGIVYSVEFARVMKTWLLVTVAMAIIGLTTGYAASSHPAIADPTNGGRELWGTIPSGHAFCWLGWLVFSITLGFSLCTLRPYFRRHLAKHDWWAQPVLVVGNGERAARLFDRLSRCRNEGLRPVGIVFDPFPLWNNSKQWDESMPVDAVVAHQALSEASEATEIAESLGRGSIVHVGPIEELDEILIRSQACRLAVTDRNAQRWNDFHCFHGIPHVAVPTDLGSHPTESVRLTESDGRVEMHCRTTLTSPQALFVKRTMDLILVIALAPLWLAVMLVIAVAIKIGDPGPIFYRQARVGRFRKPFQAIKFRSMVCDADQKLNDYLNAHPEMQSEWAATHKLKHDPRVTRIGEFLRKTSLDELPQLLNVLKGEMSLVGPRPIIDSSDYDLQYIQGHPEVFEMYQMVRPGITGLWQISGRNGTSYEARIQFDRFYLHNWSVTYDIFILWRTIKTALYREGAC